MSDREAIIRQARVYLAQARVTHFAGWRATLINWAGKCRRKAMRIREPEQASLF